MKLALMADDFTGANDLGLQLMKYGLDIRSTFFVGENPFDIEVVSSETRNLNEEEAIHICREIYEKFIGRGYDFFYKKIDSTLRGNIRAEVDILKALLPKESRIAVVVPFPKNKRTVKNGIHYVDGMELHKTFFAKDPVKPIKSSKLTDYFSEGKLVSLELIRSGKLEEYLDSVSETLLFFDGETEEDLNVISRALHKKNWDRHIVGSAAIMDHMMREWGYKKSPILILSGSCNYNNVKQLEYFGDKVDLNILDYDILNNKISGILKEGRDILLRSSNFDSDIEKTLEKYSTKNIREMIGEAAVELIKKYNIKKIISCGGDISIELMKRLHLDYFDIIYELEPGIAYGKCGEYSIITKPGGFGSEKIYKKSYSFLKKCR